MRNRIYRLVEPKTFEACEEDLVLRDGFAIVRPRYLSICAADQRYWSGRRDPAALREKLPMALIHEAVGVVEQDATGTYEPGTPVVLVPNIPAPDDPDTASKENYSRASRFHSSSADGFMRDYVTVPTERLVPHEGVEPLTAVLAELVSVCWNAADAFDAVRRVDRNTRIGIWGDGTIGYLMANVLLARNPQLQIVVFGTHQHKLERFDFAAERHNVRRGFREGRVSVDHAFECVGGTGGSTSAIAQIIDCIQPQGVLSLMGVSEQPVPINTRMVLEKGLTLQGNSRSSKQDFEHAVELFRDPAFSERAVRVIEHVAPVRTLDDAQAAFEWDEAHPYKTIMDWQM